MAQSKATYLEKQTEASITYHDEKIVIALHRAKVKLQNELEINVIKSVNPEFKKEFTLTDDLLTINLYPPASYVLFNQLFNYSKHARWRIAYNMLQSIEKHALNRLKLIVCPENIMIDQGLNPHFLYYGVKESIPPYEDDENRLWNETKAIIATIVDEKYDFETYLSHYETITLPSSVKQIMEAETVSQLYEIIAENLKIESAYEKTVIPIPVKKWKVYRYIILALSVILIPALLYTFLAAFFKIPETEAYVTSNRYFLQKQYSEVINTLEKYNYEKMPYGVQYQLASAFVINESLNENQKETIRNTITLQADRRYFLYWIGIGRGEYQEAIDTARLLEDRDLIMYGLIQQIASIKSDPSLSGADREEALRPINDELDAYEKEKKEELSEATETSSETDNVDDVTTDTATDEEASTEQQQSNNADNDEEITEKDSGK